jgi:hypothetical protein
MVKHDALKENLYNFYTANKHLSRKEIFDRFIAIGAPERSLNRWLCNLEQNKTLKRKKGSGRIAKKATPKVIKAIKRKFNHRTGCSQRKTASAFNLTVSHVNYILKKYSDIRKYKKFKRPLMNDQQRAQLRPKCRKLLNKYRDYNFIIDDESYFTLSHTTQPGNDIFYSNNIQKTPESVKNKYEIKYEKKVLVWIAISPKGMTEPFFRESGLAINRFVYRDECLDPYLLPFIKKYHRNDQYVFWPDQASAHYAKEVKDWLNSKNIEFVPKYLNPANAPKTRPIEDFWGILKGKVYAKNWSAKSIPELKRKIRICLKEMDVNLVQSIAGSVQKRLDTL